MMIFNVDSCEIISSKLILFLHDYGVCWAVYNVLTFILMKIRKRKDFILFEN